MSHSQASLKPAGLRKRKSTITVTDDELQRQRHSKMAAGDGPEHVESTAMVESTANTTIIEPDEEDNIANPIKIEDMFAKIKLEREIETERLTRKGRRVLKQILISERCTSCEVRILHMGLRFEEWRDNVDQSPIPDSAPNDELEKHQSRPDAINSKSEREKAEVDKLECAASSLLTTPATAEPENERAVATWKSIAISLLTMQSPQLILDNGSESDIWKLAARYMLEIQPCHESEGTLPGLDFVTIQNEKRGLVGIEEVPLQQMERLLSGIPDAQIVAFFILSHLPEEYHTLLSCTTIFAEERTSVWRNHVLFEGWLEEENVAFACEFSHPVLESRATIIVLQKWHRLLEVLRPIIISISSLCFAQT
ncbi:hypothetical protein V491_06219 [Pseudogymnoascus sp. VKM F-3775]|nr:hypothetical protein V491_06219 [Pseudogymnoascus sp. VKM F-3775]